MKIVAIADDQETDLDIVWVFRKNIPADGIFRRIIAQSQNGIAIVGVNVRVMCTDEASAENCTVPAALTTMMADTTTPVDTDVPTTTAGETESTTDSTTREETSTQDTTSASETIMETTTADSILGKQRYKMCIEKREPMRQS